MKPNTAAASAADSRSLLLLLLMYRQLTVVIGNSNLRFTPSSLPSVVSKISTVLAEIV